jgi:hypothetical protein
LDPLSGSRLSLVRRGMPSVVPGKPLSSRTTPVVRNVSGLTRWRPPGQACGGRMLLTVECRVCWRASWLVVFSECYVWCVVRPCRYAGVWHCVCVTCFNGLASRWRPPGQACGGRGWNCQAGGGLRVKLVAAFPFWYPVGYVVARLGWNLSSRWWPKGQAGGGFPMLVSRWIRGSIDEGQASGGLRVKLVVAGGGESECVTVVARSFP